MIQIKVIEVRKELCLSCMEVHDIKVVEIIEEEFYKDMKVKFPATYKLCDNTNELIEDEEMIRRNSLAMKISYKGALSESI